LIPQGKIRNFKGYDDNLGLLNKDSYLSSRLTNQEVSAAIEFRRQQQIKAGEIDPMTGALTDKGKEAQGRFSDKATLQNTQERLLGKRQRINQAKNMLRSGKLKKGQVQEYINTGILPEEKAQGIVAGTAGKMSQLDPFGGFGNIPAGGAGGANLDPRLPLPAGGAGGGNLDPRLPLPAGGAGGGNVFGRYDLYDPNLPLPPGAIQSGPYRPGPLPPGAIQPLAGGAPAGGGGVAGPDVAMNNLAQALNAVRDGFQINVGEINVTISNATELANSIKSVVVEAVKESVGSADLNNAPAAGSVSSMTDGPPGAYA